MKLRRHFNKNLRSTIVMRSYPEYIFTEFYFRVIFKIKNLDYQTGFKYS